MANYFQTIWLTIGVRVTITCGYQKCRTIKYSHNFHIIPRMKSPTNSNPQYYHGIFYPQAIPKNPNTPTYFRILWVPQLMAPQTSLDDWSFNDTSTRKAMHASPIMSQMPFLEGFLVGKVPLWQSQLAKKLGYKWIFEVRLSTLTRDMSFRNLNRPW